MYADTTIIINFILLKNNLNTGTFFYIIHFNQKHTILENNLPPWAIVPFASLLNLSANSAVHRDGLTVQLRTEYKNEKRDFIRF